MCRPADARRLVSRCTLQLGDVAYSSTFIPLGVLNSLGLAANIRIKPIWDVVDNGDLADGNAYQCSEVGQQIMLQTLSGGYELSPPNFCTAEHIVTGPTGSSRGTIMKSRTSIVSEGCTVLSLAGRSP